MYRPAAHIQDDELYLPAGQLGMGWWGDAWDEVKSVAKKVQANPVVRGLEKKAVDYGSKAPRGAAESAGMGSCAHKENFNGCLEGGKYCNEFSLERALGWSIRSS